MAEQELFRLGLAASRNFERTLNLSSWPDGR